MQLAVQQAVPLTVQLDFLSPEAEMLASFFFARLFSLRSVPLIRQLHALFHALQVFKLSVSAPVPATRSSSKLTNALKWGPSAVHCRKRDAVFPSPSAGSSEDEVVQDQLASQEMICTSISIRGGR